MAFDLEKHQESVVYGTALYETIINPTAKALVGYPDLSDESVLQYVFDALDEDRLDNTMLYNTIQELLNDWLVDGKSSATVKANLIDLLAGYYDFGC
jgi:hypothetical protein